MHEARELLLDDTVLPAGLTLEEEREACRALKGSMLRQEVYALDGTDEEQAHPYTVTEQNFTIACCNRSDESACGLLHPCPRGHQLSLRAQPRRSAHRSYAYAGGGRLRQCPKVRRHRLWAAPAGYRTIGGRPGQAIQLWITYTENGFTNSIDGDDAIARRLPAEARAYELTGLTLATGTSRFGFEEMLERRGSGAIADRI